MKLSDLIQQLQEILDDAGAAEPEVFLAIQPNFEHALGQVVSVVKHYDSEGREIEFSDEVIDELGLQEPGDIGHTDYVVYLAEAGQNRALPGEVKQELGWR